MLNFVFHYLFMCLCVCIA